MAFPNVADISSAQGSFDAAAYAASGRKAVIIKATEGVGYTNPEYVPWRDAAHAHGLVTGEYHYMGDSARGILHPAADEAHHFLGAVGGHAPGRFAVCDVESPQPGRGPYLYGMSAQQAADWGGAFLDVCKAEGGWPGVGYSMSGSGVIQLLRPPYLKWYAAYPGPVPGNRSLHQFTDNGPVPGVGRCDDSYCYVDLAAFASGTTAPKEEPVGAYALPVLSPGEAYTFRPPPADHTGGIGFGAVYVSFGADFGDPAVPGAAVPLRVAHWDNKVNGWIVTHGGGGYDKAGKWVEENPGIPPLYVPTNGNVVAIRWTGDMTKGSLVHAGRAGRVVPTVEYQAG